MGLFLMLRRGVEDSVVTVTAERVKLQVTKKTSLKSFAAVETFLADRHRSIKQNIFYIRRVSTPSD